MNLPVQPRDGGLQVALLVQPRASRNEIAGIQNARLKIRLTSPPVEGAANQACLRWLAKWFRLPPRQVTLVRGASSRNKVVHLQGIDETTFYQRLAELMPGGS